MFFTAVNRQIKNWTLFFLPTCNLSVCAGITQVKDMALFRDFCTARSPAASSMKSTNGPD